MYIYIHIYIYIYKTPPQNLNRANIKVNITIPSHFVHQH